MSSDMTDGIPPSSPPSAMGAYPYNADAGGTTYPSDEEMIIDSSSEIPTSTAHLHDAHDALPSIRVSNNRLKAGLNQPQVLDAYQSYENGHDNMGTIQVRFTSVKNFMCHLILADEEYWEKRGFRFKGKLLDDLRREREEGSGGLCIFGGQKTVRENLLALFMQFSQHYERNSDGWEFTEDFDREVLKGSGPDPVLPDLLPSHSS